MQRDTTDDLERQPKETVNIWRKNTENEEEQEDKILIYGD